MGTAKLDPADPPRIPIADLERLDAMTPAQVERNALDDPDDPPLTEDELDRVRATPAVRAARKARHGARQPSRHTVRARSRD